jgi:hypothetical protein
MHVGIGAVLIRMNTLVTHGASLRFKVLQADRTQGIRERDNLARGVTPHEARKTRPWASDAINTRRCARASIDQPERTAPLLQVDLS